MQEIKSDSYINLKKVAQQQHDFSNDIEMFTSQMQTIKRMASGDRPENAAAIVDKMMKLCEDIDRMKTGVDSARANMSKYNEADKAQVGGKLRALRAFVDSAETNIIDAIRTANPKALDWKVQNSTVLERIEMKYPYHLRELRLKLSNYR